jgi:hypothetical protein
VEEKAKTCRWRVFYKWNRPLEGSAWITHFTTECGNEFIKGNLTGNCPGCGLPIEEEKEG